MRLHDDVYAFRLVFSMLHDVGVFATLDKVDVPMLDATGRQSFGKPKAA